MRFAAIVALFFILTAPPLWAADAEKIEQFTLKNGLEVIIAPNHRMPAVNHTLWLKIGGGDDPRGKSGLAHFHEHVMFLGTRHYKPGEYTQLISRLGGHQNAFTTQDATGYWVLIDIKHLPTVMKLEADRLGPLMPSDAAVIREREVIIEERRTRIENNPTALFDEQLSASLYLNHPYHWPTIGWLHEMAGLTRQDVIDFHQRYYHPGNAILILSGDITAAQARPLVERYYGRLPAIATPARQWNGEPPHLAPRRLEMHHALVKQPSWTRRYLAPSVAWGKTDHAMPLFLLAQLLGGGKTSRLYQSLVVEQKLASSISASYGGFVRGPAEFALTATPSPGTSPAQLEAAVDAELTKLLAGSITPDELTRAKTLLKAETIYTRDSLAGVGKLIGWIRMLGLPLSFYTDFTAQVDRITAEQIMQAARAVLLIDQSVTGVLLPKEKP